MLRIGSGASTDLLARRAVYWTLLTEDIFLVTTAQLFPVFKPLLHPSVLRSTNGVSRVEETHQKMVLAKRKGES